VEELISALHKMSSTSQKVAIVTGAAVGPLIVMIISGTP
jgi:hypothetical protein